MPSNPDSRTFLANTLQTFPRPDRAAADAVRQWARHRGLALDPDKVDAVTLHYQLQDERWVGVVAAKMTLTQALLSNWQGESSNDLLGAVLHEGWAGDPPPLPITPATALKMRGLFKYGADYQIYNGLYRQTGAEHYGADNHVQIPAEDFQRFIWELDFLTPYKASLHDFWATGLEHYRVALKAAFLTACNRQTGEGSLSEAGKALAWQVAGVQPRPSWSSLGQRNRRNEVVEVSALDVYGYPSTDILYLRNNASGLVLLYIPGNSSPLHEFVDEAAMKNWFASQCRSSDKRESLKGHFRLSDLPTGTDFSGVENALTGLGLYPEPHLLDPNHYAGFATSGVWEPAHTLDYKNGEYSPPIDGDVFLALANRYRKRSTDDAEFVITTDARVTKAKWRGYVGTAMNILTPLAVLAPELAVLLALGGVAQFGLALDQVLEARNQQDRLEGIEGQVFGLLNALPLLHGVVSKAPELFSIKRPGFVSPRRINGQLGYPLSPVTPPQLQGELAELEPFFRDMHLVDTLPGADPQLAGAVQRIPSMKGELDKLQCSIGGYLAMVEYDIERNAFRLVSGNGPIGAYYIAPAERAASAARADSLVPLTDLDREVTDEQRMSTLRALGSRLRLPVDYPAMHPVGATPLPKKVSCLWVGQREMGEPYLSTLAKNAQRLKNSTFEHRLFLSSQSPEMFAINSAKIKAVAPSLEIVELEAQEGFKAFQASDYYAQYQAALDGNGGVAINEASASDILRYRLLKWEGGLYMDCDDEILALGIDIPGQGPAMHIDELALVADERGLLVSFPVSDERLGMKVKFNSSLLGSHAGNPVLDDISNEMLARYRAYPDFYSQRPKAEVNLPAHQRYARQLNYMTGPGLLNDVIDTQLPPLSQLRELCDYVTLPRADDALGPLEQDRYSEAVSANMPFTFFARIGNGGSWE